MINLQLPSQATIENTEPAQEFQPGETFYDCDGDLYLRCRKGCVRFEQDALVVYSENTLRSYGYFNRCAPAKINVNVTFH